MASGGGWFAYPWGDNTSGGGYYTSAGATSVSYPVWTFQTGGSYYEYSWPPAQQEAERPPLPESAMDWLRRRVTEITDLAYAGV